MRLAVALILAAATVLVTPAAQADTPNCVSQGEFTHVDDVVSSTNPKYLSWVENQFSDQQLSSVAKWSGGVLVGMKYPSCGWTPKDTLVPVITGGEGIHRVVDICLAANTNDWSC